MLLVHATLQRRNIGEKQSKFLMLGDIFSDPEYFNPSKTETPEKCLSKCWLLSWTFNLDPKHSFLKTYIKMLHSSAVSTPIAEVRMAYYDWNYHASFFFLYNETASINYDQIPRMKALI